jgi:hypothetical protein
MQRRSLLHALAAALGSLSLPARTSGAGAGDAPAREQAATPGDRLRLTPARLLPIADAVLPESLGDAGRRAVAADFLAWHHEYRAGAEMDHGYGFTRLRTTPEAPSARYEEQLAELDRAARSRGATFAALPVADRRALLDTALASAGIERLPARPTGGHVAADLMGFYFNSSAAADDCYRAVIGRDACRGLQDSDRRPTPFPR